MFSHCFFTLCVANLLTITLVKLNTEFLLDEIGSCNQQLYFCKERHLLTIFLLLLLSPRLILPFWKVLKSFLTAQISTVTWKYKSKIDNKIILHQEKKNYMKYTSNQQNCSSYPILIPHVIPQLPINQEIQQLLLRPTITRVCAIHRWA